MTNTRKRAIDAAIVFLMGLASGVVALVDPWLAVTTGAVAAFHTFVVIRQEASD